MDLPEEKARFLTPRILLLGLSFVSLVICAVSGAAQPSNPLRLERDEFNRAEGAPDATYVTLISPRDATTVVHLFLHDYDDTRVLSFCGGTPFII